MQKLKHFLSSSLNRVILLVFAVLIPLNLLTLVLGQRVMAESEKQIGLELQHTLSLYLNLAGEATKRVDTYLALLSIDNPDFLRLRDKEIDREEERYRQVQAVVDLQTNLKKKREDEFFISAIFAYYPEISAGKELHCTFNPCFYKEFVIRLRHFIHLNSKTTKYPCLMYWVQVIHSIPTVVAMEISCIQHVVS